MLRNRKTNRLSLLKFIVPLFLVLALPVAVYLTQQTTFFQPRANNELSLATFSLITKNSLNLYTADSNEKSQAISTYGFTDANVTLGKLFKTAQPDTRPLYRFNTGTGYFYTGSEEEASAVSGFGWTREGIAGYIYPTAQTGTIPLYRFRKEGLWGLGTDRVGSQTFTDQGFTRDGVIGYIYPQDYVVSQPVASPSPAAAPQNKTQIGAFFFYWFDCPSSSYQCDKTKMPFQPSNYQSYSATKVEWFKNEVKEMSRAGIDIIIAVSWGSQHPSLSTLRDTQSIPLLVQALRETNSTQKIALLDDTNSVVAEWNVDQGRAYSNPTENPAIPKMSLSNDANWSYFYDRKIKPFYQMVPREYWATHNGQSLTNGGRPIIFIYDAPRSFTNLEYSDEMWVAIKNAFAQDFQVEPFIILDYSWFDFNPQRSELEKVANGKFIWAGGNDTVPKRHTLNDYTTTSIDPGFECPSWDIYVGCQSKSRHIDPFTGRQGNGERLKGTFQNAVGSNLILVETWNELNEGSGIAPSSQYKNRRGGILRPNFYQDTLLNLKKTYITR